jgi:hypothetical protein
LLADGANNPVFLPPASRRALATNRWNAHMANRSGLFLTAALVGLLSAPAWAAAADEPVATAPIPPPPAAAAPAPDKPAFVNPNPAKASPKPAETAAKRPVRSAAKSGHDKKVADRHRPSRHAKKEQHVVAHAMPTPPPFRRLPPRPRYYAGDLPPPPWYDRDVYYPGPWRRGMIMPW